ncbi:cuticle protein 16.5-like [Uranotaenia lowii]|uniref:cuticle protein 16.5-like n=1 Tax=Uranotaenia lowii TaxID=190385 RepID=UPI00247A3EF7|nr:cuticle protein 16.5-like [Uranotaenia lowii]
MKLLIVLSACIAAASAAPQYYGAHGYPYAFAPAPVAPVAPVVKYAAPVPDPVYSYYHPGPAVHAVAPAFHAAAPAFHAAAPAPAIVKAAVPAATSYATFHQVHTPVVAAAPAAALVKYTAPAPYVVHAASAPLIKYPW